MNDPRILDAITHADEYIAYLQTLPDKQLQKKLGIIRAQQQLAWKQKNERALDLLEVWERQVIEARYIRNEDDVPLNTEKPPKKKTVTEEPEEAIKEATELMETPVSEIEEIPSAPTQMALF